MRAMIRATAEAMMVLYRRIGRYGFVWNAIRSGGSDGGRARGYTRYGGFDSSVDYYGLKLSKWVLRRFADNVDEIARVICLRILDIETTSYNFDV
jgi:hypothetical protein